MSKDVTKPSNLTAFFEKKNGLVKPVEYRNP